LVDATREITGSPRVVSSSVNGPGCVRIRLRYFLFQSMRSCLAGDAVTRTNAVEKHECHEAQPSLARSPCCRWNFLKNNYWRRRAPVGLRRKAGGCSSQSELAAGPATKHQTTSQIVKPARPQPSKKTSTTANFLVSSRLNLRGFFPFHYSRLHSSDYSRPSIYNRLQRTFSGPASAISPTVFGSGRLARALNLVRLNPWKIFCGRCRPQRPSHRHP
jgi:hypothetical protein